MYIGRRVPSRTGGGVFPGRNSHRKRCRPLGALFREKAYAQDAIRAVSRCYLCRTGVGRNQVGPPDEGPRTPQEAPPGRAGRGLPKRPVRGSSARGRRARARANSGLVGGRAACSRKPPKSEERPRPDAAGRGTSRPDVSPVGREGAAPSLPFPIPTIFRHGSASPTSNRRRQRPDRPTERSVPRRFGRSLPT